MGPVRHFKGKKLEYIYIYIYFIDNFLRKKKSIAPLPVVVNCLKNIKFDEIIHNFDEIINLIGKNHFILKGQTIKKFQ